MEAKASRNRVIEVRVSDLAAAALLLANGCRLRAVEPTEDPRRKAFVVEGETVLVRRLLDAYSRSDVSVELNSFLAAQRLLKDRLFRTERVAALTRL